MMETDFLVLLERRRDTDCFLVFFALVVRIDFLVGALDAVVRLTRPHVGNLEDAMLYAMAMACSRL